MSMCIFFKSDIEEYICVIDNRIAFEGNIWRYSIDGLAVLLLI